MTNHWCVNGTSLDTHSYSSPVPFIGLHIASATSVCFLFMLIDVIKGLINGKQWLPCGFFSLNSLTLTLLSAATKIPLDLTTSMPSASDQLSKLCGTTMICVSMGVLMPSVGANSYSESISNIVALYILVTTIIFNICIQISTGVIYSFITEHVIILICMLALWIVLCFSTIHIHIEDDTVTTLHRIWFQFLQPSLMSRVQNWYSKSSVRDGQRSLCSGIICSSVVFLCALCSAVLSQAAIRSIALKKLQFCEGLADYRWSVGIIVISQITFVVVGTLLTIFRFMISPTGLRRNTLLSLWKHEFVYMRPYCVLATRNVLGILVSIFKCFVLLTMTCLCTVSAIVPVVLLKPCLLFKNPRYDDREGEDLSKLIQGYKKDPLTNLNELLHTHRQRPLTVDRITEKSCLLVVMLVRVTTALLPPDRSKSLNRAMDEVFEIISYLDKKINKEPQRYARIWWMGRGISSQQLPLTRSPADPTPEAAVTLEISIFKELVDSLCQTLGFQLEGMYDIINVLNDEEQRCISMEELYDRIEQVFCALVRFFLAQLPKVLIEEINGCHIGEYEEKGRHAIKLLCKMEPLEDKIQWLFPEPGNILYSVNITSLITEVPGAPVLNRPPS